jgi:hypothetical protein
MASRSNVGWERVVIIAIVSTSFAVLMDKLGVINAIEDAVKSWR